MRQSAHVIIIAFLIGAPLHANGFLLVNDTTEANSFKAEAYNLAKSSSYDSAIVYFEKAARQYKTIQLWDSYVECYVEIADNKWKSGDYEAADKSITEALKKGLEKLPKNSPTIANVYHVKAVLKDVAGQADEAILLYNQSLDIRLEVLGKNHPDVAKSYFDQGILYRTLGEFEKALDLFNKSLKIRLKAFGEENADVAACYNVLGVMSDNMGNYMEAMEYYQKALAIRISTLGENHPEVATTYSNISILYKTKGDFEQATKYNQMALKSRIENFGESHPVVATTYNNMGTVSREMGDFDESLAYHGQALEMRKQIFGENHSEVAASYQNIAITHAEKKDFDEAQKYYKKALFIDSITFGAIHPYVAGGYFNMGVTYKDQNQYDLAIEHFKKAMDIDIEVFGESHPHMATTHMYLGQVYTKKKDFKMAQAAFDKAMAIHEKNESAPELAVALAYQEIGNLYNAMEQYQKAIGFYQKTIIELSESFDNQDYCTNPKLGQIVSKRQIITALNLKAEAIASLDQDDSYNCQVDIYRLLIEIIGALRTDYAAESSKLILAERARKIFDKGIKSILDSPQKGNVFEATKEAFSMAESNKNNLLMQNILASEAKRFAGIPDSIIQKEKLLKIDLAFYSHELQKQRSADDTLKSNSLKDQVFQLQQESAIFVNQLEKEYPQYYQLKYDRQPLDIANLQKNILSKDEMVIAYHHGEEEIYVFLLTKDDLNYFIVESSKDIENHARSLLRNIKDHHFKGFVENAFLLYQKILQPALNIAQAEDRGYDHLIIIPDGILGYIPFETLIQSKAKPGDGYQNLNYLVRDFKVTNQYSPKLLTLKRVEGTAATKKEFLGFAPTFIDKASSQYLALNERTRAFVDSLTALPDAAKEVENIAELLNGRAQIGLAATEHNFKQMAGDYKILHLASHSIIEDEDPLYSKLLFDNEQDSIEDGFLHTYELYNMDLNADLVTLSACNTGVGKLYKGEGIMSLARGFMYAGVPNLVMSLWSVSDKPTKDLMTYFYEELKNGESKSGALRKAKLRYLEQADNYTADPYYWSSFIYVGQLETEADSSSNYIWVYLLGLVLLLSGLVIWRKRPSNTKVS